MRYQKVDDLLQLAARMQGSVSGVSLTDIQDWYRVSRRTAERMRDSVIRVFGAHIQERWDHDGLKRWSILPQTAGLLGPAITADDLAILRSAIERSRRDGLDDHAEALEGIDAKLRSLLDRRVSTRIEPDLEFLLEAEGFATRPGPRPRAVGHILRTLRHAMKGSTRVVLHYRSRWTGTESIRTVEPYGFLYGRRHYLVASDQSARERNFRLFALTNIERIEQTDATFSRDPSFCLADYASMSFGAYQEDPVDVVWRVSPSCADEARDYIFHPSQQFEDCTDGSLIVRFRAGGLLEMCWHLFTWRGDIEIIAPTELADLMGEQLRLATAAVRRVSDAAAER